MVGNVRSKVDEEKVFDVLDSIKERSEPADNDEDEYGYPDNWQEIREEILDRDNYTCQDCGKSNIPLEVHHIIPASSGGPHTENNLTSLCVICHRVDRHDKKWWNTRAVMRGRIYEVCENEEYDTFSHFLYDLTSVLYEGHINKIHVKHMRKIWGKMSSWHLLGESEDVCDNRWLRDRRDREDQMYRAWAERTVSKHPNKDVYEIVNCLDMSERIKECAMAQTTDKTKLTWIKGIGESRAKKLKEMGCENIEDVANLTRDRIEVLDYVGPVGSRKILKSAKSGGDPPGESKTVDVLLQAMESRNL